MNGYADIIGQGLVVPNMGEDTILMSGSTRRSIEQLLGRGPIKHQYGGRWAL
jgi:hypothetical protein